MSLMGIAALTSAGISGIKAISQGIKARKEKKSLDQLLKGPEPKAEISKGFMDYYKSAQQRAAGQMPGYGQRLEQIGQVTAKTQDYLKEGAMSSQQLMQGTLTAQDKELQAIQNLGMESVQWRDQAKLGGMQASQQLGQQQQDIYQQNVLTPYNTALQMGAEAQQAASQNAWGGFQDLASGLMNYAGTKGMLDMYKSMYPQGGTTPPLATNALPGSPYARFNMGVQQNLYRPGQNAQQDLTKTLMGLPRKV